MGYVSFREGNGFVTVVDGLAGFGLLDFAP